MLKHSDPFVVRGDTHLGTDIIGRRKLKKNKKDEKKYNDIDYGDDRIFLLRAKQ
jgi:hypothetical protein